MKLKQIVVLSAILFISSCNQTDRVELHNNNVPDDTFELSIKAYKFSYNNKNFVGLMDERHYYFILENLGLLKQKQDYFVDKRKFIENFVKLDSTSYFNNIHILVFLDSCNQTIVEGWVEKFRKNSNESSDLLNKDTTLKKANLHCVFYALLKDSFNIYQEDVSGNYNITK